MATNLGNKARKKEKTIKHGMIALTAMIIAFLLIAIGIYLYGPYNTPEVVKPIETNVTSQ